MNMNTSRLDDKLNGLFLAALVAIVIGANFSALQSEPQVMAAAPAPVVAQVATASTPLQQPVQ